MSAAVSADPHHPQPVNLTKFGMMTFLASEAMLFGGLISAYLILWISRGSGYLPSPLKAEGFTWPLLMTGINTLFLFASSGTLYIGEKGLLKGKSITGWLALTTLLGAIFVSVQAVEWTHLFHENIWFNQAHGPSTTYNSSFFTLTGFHGLHVSIGVFFLAVTTLMSAAGKFTPHRHDFLTCVSLYWHFVDIVWVGLFAVMYILPYFYR